MLLPICEITYTVYNNGLPTERPQSYSYNKTKLLQIEIFNQVKMKIFGFFFAIVQCDMIGYNRLGNNVGHHISHRGFRAPMSQNKYQILKWLVAEESKLSGEEKRKWFKTLSSRKRPQNTLRNNRLNRYKYSMTKYE